MNREATEPGSPAPGEKPPSALKMIAQRAAQERLHRYHGICIRQQEDPEFRFGIVNLIARCQPWTWFSDGILAEDIKQSLKRFTTPRYRQCAAKSRYTVFQVHRAVTHLSECLGILEHEKQYLFDGAPMETASIALGARDEIPYHMDALLMHLRILADCIAAAVPYFYITSESIASRSFRDQRKWFLKHDGFDNEYASILKRSSRWFDVLAGTEPKGIRDSIVHDFATYQHTSYQRDDGLTEVVIQQVTDSGIVVPDLSVQLVALIGGFFYFLDGVFELFASRLHREGLWPAPDQSARQSRFMSFSGEKDPEARFRFYPQIQCD